MTATLEIAHLRFAYPGTPPLEVLADVNLTLGPGEIVAVTGQSGGGKSTLLHTIVGLAEPASGTIELGGRSLSGVPVHKREVGLVFQDGQLFPHRTVARNVAFGLERQGVPRRERQREVRALLDLVGLEGMSERSVGELSGGQRQRVAVARALAPRPRLMLLDEPLSSLDPESRLEVGQALVGALRARSTPALLVTHDLAEARNLADRVVELRAGTIVAS